MRKVEGVVKACSKAQEAILKVKRGSDEVCCGYPGCSVVFKYSGNSDKTELFGLPMCARVVVDYGQTLGELDKLQQKLERMRSSIGANRRRASGVERNLKIKEGKLIDLRKKGQDLNILGFLRNDVGEEGL